MLFFIAAFIFLSLGILYKKTKGNIGNTKILDGEIIEVDEACKEIKVRYTINGITYFFTANEGYGDFSKLTPGTKVLVNTEKNSPQNPRIILYNTKNRNRSLIGSQNAAFIAAIVSFIAGIMSLLK